MIFFHPCQGVVQRVLTAGFYSYFFNPYYFYWTARVFSYPLFLQIVEVAVGDIWGLRPMVLFQSFYSYFHTVLLIVVAFDKLISYSDLQFCCQRSRDSALEGRGVLK